MTPRRAPHKLKLAVLEVSSYTNIGSIGAEHWYGKISCNDGLKKETLELKRKLSDPREVDHLNRKDEIQSKFFAWKIGQETNRFPDRAAVCAAAVQAWRKAFPGYDALIVGLYAICDPQEPLDARDPKIMKALQAFWARRRKLGGYERNPAGMEKLWKSYNAYTEGPSPKKKRRVESS